MPMDYEEQWAEIGQRLQQLAEQLEAVSDESPHALQAHKILNNVRACEDDWAQMEASQGAGRPRGIFPQQGTETAFCAALTALLTDCAGPKGVKVQGVGNVSFAEFYALCYDACVQYEVASGVDDLKAFYAVISRVSKQILGDDIFRLSYVTLTKKVNHWGELVKPNGSSRVFLHTVSMSDALFVAYKRELSQLKTKLMYVSNLLEKYELIPRTEHEKGN